MGWVLLVIVFLASIAAWSRISTMTETPGYITNMFDAVSNLFKGALGQ